MLPERLLLLLRDWWRAGRQQGILVPDGWLFPGQSAAAPISTRQLYRVVVEAAEAADIDKRVGPHTLRSEEHTSELQPLMRTSYAVYCLKKTQTTKINKRHDDINAHINSPQTN